MASEQGSSGLLSEQSSFLWKTPNFLEIRKCQKKIKEQEFQFNTSVGIVPLKWRCYLNPCKDKGQLEWQGAFRLHLCLENVPPVLTNSQAKFHFEIGSKDKERSYFNAGAVDITLKQVVGTRLMVTFGENKLRQLYSDDTVLPADGTLEIRITITIFHGEFQNAELAILEANFVEKFRSTFRKQFTAFLKNPTVPTIKIVAKDGVEFSVDRVVLAARSPVFRAMFQANMSEERDSVVEVKDMDSKSLEVLLHFLHTAELTGNWKEDGVIEGLVYGANKYMLEDLKQFLDKVLGFLCTDQNCGKLAGLAKAFGMIEVEQQLFEYFKQNLAKNLDDVLRFAEDTANAASLMAPTVEEVQERRENREEEEQRRTECYFQPQNPYIPSSTGYSPSAPYYYP